VSAGEADTHIGSELSIRGKLLGKGSVRIEGRLEGEIDIDGVLTLGASARVLAPIHADAVSVAGEIEGRVEAKTLVEVHVGGCIYGDVRAPQVTVDEGGQVTGRIEKTSPTIAMASEPSAEIEETSEIEKPAPLRPLGRVKARVRATRRSLPPVI
jgi:cytoskeletal protein CcmA (bactofilin family)